MQTQLSLTRKINESIKVDGPCTIEVLKISGRRVTLEIRAESHIKIMRTEVELREEAA